MKPVDLGDILDFLLRDAHRCRASYTSAELSPATVRMLVEKSRTPKLKWIARRLNSGSSSQRRQEHRGTNSLPMREMAMISLHVSAPPSVFVERPVSAAVTSPRPWMTQLPCVEVVGFSKFSVHTGMPIPNWAGFSRVLSSPVELRPTLEM